MLTINMHEAKSKLSALVAAVESGEQDQVILTRSGKPAARIVPLDQPKGITFGLAKGEFDVPDDIDEYEDEIAAMFHGDDARLSDAAE